MPFSRIALKAGTSSAFRQTLSEILHRTLVDFFAVPADDCFQLFDEYHSGRRIFPRFYQGGPRSDNFIWFSITAGKPRTAEQKQQLYSQLCRRLHDELAIRPEDVMITLCFTQPEDWSFANGSLFRLSEENAV